MSDQGFMGVRSSSDQSVISQFSGADSRGMFGVGEELNLWIEDFMCAIV
jgi:hypothetical protein